MMQHLVAREETTAPPRFQVLYGPLNLVKEDLVRLNMVTRYIPRFNDFFLKSGNPQRKVFERERPRAARSSIIGKEEWTMVRKRGRKGEEDM
jgi:hypothetical protein